MVRVASWSEFLSAKADASLARSSEELRGTNTSAIVADLPAVEQRSFVHLDAFAGNMLTVGALITAVIDFGPSCVAGDRRFDAISCAAYLSTPLITPTMVPQDAAVAASWLRAVGLDDLHIPVRRWIVAFWAFAVDDELLHQWCREVLLGG